MNDIDLRIELARLDERLKAVIDENDRAHAATKYALELQAHEYERRLMDLNHAHAEAQRVLSTYLPRETAERDREKMGEQIDDLKAFKNNLQGRLWIGGSLILIIAATISAVVPMLSH